MTVPQRLERLRKKMLENGIDAYLVPTDDFHGSEYVGEYFTFRKYITGFTGSAGTAVILQDQAGLWTDGRYFIQAEQQLKGSGVTLYKMREEGVPTVEEFLETQLAEGQTLGFDGRTVTASAGDELVSRLTPKGVKVNGKLDLAGEIWEDRPALSAEPVWILGTEYTGEPAEDKLRRVREEMQKKNATHLVLTSLDDIAWLLNLRGNDVQCNPVFLSYMVITEESAVLYAQTAAFPEEVRGYLDQIRVQLREYFLIYEEISKIPGGAAVMADPSKVNYSLRHLIPHEAAVIPCKNPTTLMKAVKNEREMENIIKAHIKDGVAVTRFIYWLKTHVGKEKITEVSSGEKLEEFRRMGENYIGPSFHPIMGYDTHGAIIHYSADANTDIPLEPRAALLSDSGGQYLEGTTDITRTIVLGETTRKFKEYFTRVLRGHLNLAAAHFLYGCAGRNLDYLAREPLWELGEDYNHGTGHGVGFCLNVHEGPNSFHYRKYPGRDCEVTLEEGMLTSDEPGYYLENEFGIRHENLTLCRKAEKTAAGQFMCFETVTLVPFDLDGILPEMMTRKEKDRLNDYHKKVYTVIGPLLPDEERAWLKEATKEI